MTNQQYCKKTEMSKKILVWHLLDGKIIKETDQVSARNPMTFRAFQYAEILKIENTRTENHVYLNIKASEVF